MRTILVVDDNAMARNTIARVLEREGYRVILAIDGLRALASFRKEPPDLVITDIIMPEREGIGTIREMLAEQPATKIIAISGGGRMGRLDFLQIAEKIGARAIMRKPIDPDEFIKLVSDCLNAKETQEAHGNAIAKHATKR